MTNKLDLAQLVPGAIVMVGPSTLPNGRKDRSWTDTIWRVEATTGNAILCRRMSRLLSYANVIFMRFEEHTWWSAEHVLEAYQKAEAETDAAYHELRRKERERAENPTGLAVAVTGTIS